jgi:hypothetical protein
MSYKPHLIGRYTDDEIELVGDTQSLQWLVTQLVSKGEVHYEFSRPVDSSAAPYDNFLAALQVSVTDDPVLIILRGSTLEISGGFNGLASVAQNIEFFVNQVRELGAQFAPPHIHIEYFPDHPYLASLSIPLVIIFEEGSAGRMG